MRDFHLGAITYRSYSEEICATAFVAVFGGICLALCFWRPGMRDLLIPAELRHALLMGGLALVGLAILRLAVCIYGGTTNGTRLGAWRYVLLSVPVILFFLDLPNQLPNASASDPGQSGLSCIGPKEYVSFFSSAGQPFQPVLIAATLRDFSGPLHKVRLRVLLQQDAEPISWNGKFISVAGQFLPSANGDRGFFLYQFVERSHEGRVFPSGALVVCDEPLDRLTNGQWVNVTGRVAYREMDGVNERFLAVLLVASRDGIVPINDNPYID